MTTRRLSGAIVAETTTDAAGAFAVPGVEPGWYQVSAQLDGFATAQVEIEVGRWRGPVEIVLEPGALSESLIVVGDRLVGSEEALRRVPGSYDAVTRDDLAASHVFTVSEALRKVPGVTVRDEEGLGLRPNVGLRGLNPTRSSKVLMLEDGLPLTYAPYGDNATYYHPPIERFDRIEVLKGSSQIAYGPVTLGGVVNYVTPDTPVRPTLSLEVTGGNRDYLNAGLSGGRQAGQVGLFGHVVRKQGSGAREHVDTRLDDLLAKVSWAPSATHQLGVKVTQYREDSTSTYSGLRETEYLANSRANPFLNDHFDGRRFGASATYHTLLGTRLSLTVQGYGSRFSRDWWRQSSNSSQRPNDATDPACGGMTNLSTTCGNQGRLRSYAQGGVETRGRWALPGTAGQEVDFGLRVHGERQDRRQENGATPTARVGVLVEDNERTAKAFSGFVQPRFLGDRWTFTPGLRIEHVRYDRTNRLVDVTGHTNLTEFVPGAGTSFTAAGLTVFAGVHRGFAPPRVEDIISNTTGASVELDPERSWNYEAGVRTRGGETWQASATVFRLDYSNQIVPSSVAGGIGATLTNGGETLHQGVEAGLNFERRRLCGSAHGVYVATALTWLPVARFAGTRHSGVPGFASVSVAGNRLPYAPETTATLTVGYRHAIGIDVQVEGQHVSDHFGDDLNTVAPTPDGQRGEVPAYAYWNLSASAPLSTWPVRAFLAIKNVADSTFIVDRTRGILPGHPRLVHAGLSFRF